MGTIQHTIPGQRCRHHARPQRHDEVRQHRGGLPLVRGDPRVEVGKRGLEQRLPDVGPQFVLRILPGSPGPDLLPAKEQSTAAVFPDFPAPIPEFDNGPVPHSDRLAIGHVEALELVRECRTGRKRFRTDPHDQQTRGNLPDLRGDLQSLEIMDGILNPPLRGDSVLDVASCGRRPGCRIGSRAAGTWRLSGAGPRDRKSTRLNSSHSLTSRMPSSA